jgi:hypothetical protein
VVVDKPVTCTSDEASELISLAREVGKVFAPFQSLCCMHHMPTIPRTPLYSCIKPDANSHSQIADMTLIGGHSYRFFRILARYMR